LWKAGSARRHPITAIAAADLEPAYFSNHVAGADGAGDGHLAGRSGISAGTVVVTRRPWIASHRTPSMRARATNTFVFFVFFFFFFFLFFFVFFFFIIGA